MIFTSRELLQLNSPRDQESNQTETTKNYYSNLEGGPDYRPAVSHHNSKPIITRIPADETK
jgi:hypothetical protein